jgi:cytochrome oxidase Cu insertion factor (SCO1/SenC/PrrC family)
MSRRVVSQGLWFFRTLKTLLVVAGLMALPTAWGQGAQTPPAASAPASSPTPTLRGFSLEGQPFDLAARRGRVVMVVLWRTDCAVCLSKMPELRANALGWKDKPFDLVTISLDAQRADALAYDSARRLVARDQGPLWSFWRGDVLWTEASAARSRLPVTLIFDDQGVLRSRHEGRVPGDVWDELADLLP